MTWKKVFADSGIFLNSSAGHLNIHLEELQEGSRGVCRCREGSSWRATSKDSSCQATYLLLFSLAKKKQLQPSSHLLPGGSCAPVPSCTLGLAPNPGDLQQVCGEDICSGYFSLTTKRSWMRTGSFPVRNTYRSYYC